MLGHRTSREADGCAERRCRGDGGSTSLTVALLTPVVVMLAFAAWQAALWSHARTEARVVARDTAASVARSATSPGDAAGAATAVLSADTSMRAVQVAVSESDGVVVVTIEAEAPGMIVGTARDISVTVAVPVEELTTP